MAVRLTRSDRFHRFVERVLFPARAGERRERELVRLFDLVQHGVEGTLLDDVLDQIYDRFEGIIPFERMSCAFLSEDQSSLTAYWAKSRLPGENIGIGYTRPMAGSSLEAVLATGKPRIIGDLEAYLAAKPGSEPTRSILAEGGRSSLTCPLYFDDQPIGFLFFTSAEPHAYDESGQGIFRLIAGLLSVAILRSRTNTALVAHNRLLTRRSLELESLDARDWLTGLLNRTAIDAVLHRAFVRQTKFGAILIDVDRFKEINETLGHAAGDAVLRQLCNRIREDLRKTDSIGRYGGDEFLLVTRAATRTELQGLAERLRRCIAEQPFDTGGAMIDVTVSLGAALFDADDSGPERLLGRANQALYVAKGFGRNRVVVAEDGAGG